MDEQRRRKKGKANYWVVITIANESIRSNLKEVHRDLEEKYKSARGELRKAFTDLDSNELHISLFGIHANRCRLEQVKSALASYRQYLTENTLDRTFDIELKGLGAWNTVGGNIVLYADLSPASSEMVKKLAKEMRDYVMDIVKHTPDSPNTQVEEEEEEDTEEVFRTHSTQKKSKCHCSRPMTIARQTALKEKE